MIEKVKISPHQFKLIVILVYIGSSILVIPGILASEVKQDAWISALLGILFGLLLVWLYNSLGDKFGNMTLVEYSEKILGKWIGKLISLFFVMFLFINCSTLIYIFGNFITTEILTETPIQFTNIIFIAVIIMGTRYGLETFAKASEILYPLVLVLLIMLLIFLCKDIDLKNIQPVFEYEIKHIVKGSLLYVSYSSLTLVALMMIFPAYVNNKKEAKKSFLIGTLTGGIIIFFLTFFVISVLDPNIAALNEYSTFTLAKKINVGKFLERLEAIVTLLWFITIFYKTIIYFYGIVFGLAQILKLKDYKPLTLPSGILVVIFSLIIYPNSSYANKWNSTTWVSFALTSGFFIPLLLLLVGKIRKIKNKY